VEPHHTKEKHHNLYQGEEQNRTTVSKSAHCQACIALQVAGGLLPEALLLLQLDMRPNRVEVRRD
jgi:hypothetical protein